MKVFIEITIIPNSEVNLYFIWSRLYTQLHLALVEIQDAHKQVSVGVSFPEYKFIENGDKKFSALGSNLRIFSRDEETLMKLNLNKWLERLTDYVHIRSIQPVPEEIKQYLIVNRYRFPKSPEALARRFASRKGVSFDEALHRLKTYKPTVEALPYVQLKSLSNNKPFTLFISQQEVDVAKEGAFSTYGLSSETTVPHW